MGFILNFPHSVILILGYHIEVCQDCFIQKHLLESFFLAYNACSVVTSTETGMMVLSIFTRNCNASVPQFGLAVVIVMFAVVCELRVVTGLHSAVNSA
jgi:hypothetical protein